MRAGAYVVASRIALTHRYDEIDGVTRDFLLNQLSVGLGESKCPSTHPYRQT
jgi:hypothetical protein